MTRAGIAPLVVVALLAAACDRDLVPSPRARHDARDDADARRLADQLAALPGVARASVVVHRPFTDPLGPASAPSPGPGPGPTASILVVDAGAPDPARLAADVRTLAAAALPDLPPGAIALVVAPPAHPPVVTTAVGPFEVAAGSRRALQITLALALVAIAALAGALAYRERHRLARR